MLTKLLEFLIVLVGVIFLIAWLATPVAQADEPAAPAKSRRDEFACPGMHAEWLDAHTVQCLKEKP